MKVGGGIKEEKVGKNKNSSTTQLKEHHSVTIDPMVEMALVTSSILRGENLNTGKMED